MCVGEAEGLPPEPVNALDVSWPLAHASACPCLSVPATVPLGVPAARPGPLPRVPGWANASIHATAVIPSDPCWVGSGLAGTPRGWEGCWAGGIGGELPHPGGMGGSGDLEVCTLRR